MTRRNIGDGGNTYSLAIDSSSLGASTKKMEGWTALPTSPPGGGRPALTSHQSNSLPSTPYQRPRNRTNQSRSPSLGPSALNASPRSSHSDSNHSMLPLRRGGGGCKYETGMAKARRRVPYSLGPEKLEAVSHALKAHLNPSEDEKLSGDMRELYDRLQPSPESEERRGRLVKKLEKLLNDSWPGHSIQVHVFGSSGNKLGTTDSDVDICITTGWTELEHVCILAKLLANSGMERVVCVSSAKVPIVKCWDPELRLACDMNVNNTVALENTELIRAYVSLDERVRPLAMIIKHWTRRRVLNDAALGGTLSSYTWICMIINFLQTRDPPILPNLQGPPRDLPKREMGGVNVAFDKDLALYSGFGTKNKDSLGELLFQFFRYYGHELDFEENVVSVRLGRTLPKRQKGWHQLQDNRLCVEEPFNYSRNLGNTADDTSMRGIHLELRRAFGVIAEGKLDECCKEYEPPQDTGRTSDIFKPPVSRPVLTQAPAQTARVPKSSNRGGRHGPHFNRGSSTAGRRPSNPSTRGSAYLRSIPFQMTPQELQLQAQHQQHLLHDRLFQQYQYLQAQEQELRMQLHQQALLQGRMPSTMSYPHIAFPSYATQDDSYDEDISSRTSSLSRASMSAPLHQQRFAYGSPHLTPIYPVQGVTTNPSSPHLNSAVPITRRYMRRSSMTQSTMGGSLRAHSQPPRSMPVPTSFSHSLQPNADDDAVLRGQGSSRPAISTSFIQLAHRPAQYLGYIVGQSPSLTAYNSSAGVSPIPSHVGLAIQNGGLSPRSFSQMPRSPFESHVSTEDPLPPDTAPGLSTRGRKLRSKSNAREKARESVSQASVPQSAAKVAVNGTTISYKRGQGVDDPQEPPEAMTFSATTSEDLTFDTPSSSDNQSQAGPESAVGDYEQSLPTLEPETTGSTKGLGRIASLRCAQPRGPSLHMPNELEPVKENNQKINEIQTHDSVDLKLNTIRLGGKLSPSTEARTPSPSRETAGGGRKGPQLKGKPENPSIPAPQCASPEVVALSSKPNGQAPSTPSVDLAKGPPLANGWQTQQKKRRKPKKAVKSENDADLVNHTGGDTIPVDDTLRKGG